MLTADEVCMAGGVFNTNNTSYYLYTGDNWWLGSPSDMGSSYAYGFSVYSDGKVSSNGVVSSTYGLRPVISLKSTVKVSGGDGTSADPYVIDTTQS
jgi:hypothetical protein